jgi:hypothetical protein
MHPASIQSKSVDQDEEIGIFSAVRDSTGQTLRRNTRSARKEEVRFITP